MQSHPVPQNIMQVEFQLVGVLTLSQFGYLAAAGILAWLVYITPLFLFIRLAIALMIVALGLALAFLPINDMKFEKWLIAFFKAIYSPTRRVWLKQAKAVDFLTNRLDAIIARPLAAPTLRVNNRARLDLFLSTRQAQSKNSLDSLEERRLNSLDFQAAAPMQLATEPNLTPDYLPVETVQSEIPRVVEETAEPQLLNKIASKVIFTPVATIKLPDKNIFVKAVSSKRSHYLNPKTAREGTIHLPIRGERLFQVSQELTQRLNKYFQPQPQKVATEVMMAESSQPIPIHQFTSQASAPTVNIYVNNQPKPPALGHNPPPTGNVSPNTATTTAGFRESVPVGINLPPITINNPPPAPQFAKPDQEKEELQQNIAALNSAESHLQGELERYQNQEKILQEQVRLSRENASSAGQSVKLKELEEELKSMQLEKEKAVSRAEKLEGVISQLSTTQPRPTFNREIITPQVGQEVKPPAIHVISPRRAEGKMAPPTTTVPNVINGVVKDANGLLLPDTIIVVKDKNDEPARALKTNKVGQFAISTALPNGTYIMEVEKESYEFDYIEIKLAGEILPPIEIRSRGGQGGTS